MNLNALPAYRPLSQKPLRAMPSQPPLLRFAAQSDSPPPASPWQGFLNRQVAAFSDLVKELSQSASPEPTKAPTPQPVATPQAGKPQTAGGKPLGTPEAVQQALDRISFKPGYRFVLQGDSPNNMKVQVQFMSPDVGVPGSKADWRDKTTLWDIPSNYSAGQLEQKLLQGIYAVDEHELRENFRYQGLKIFNPHFIPDNQRAFLQERSTQPTAPDTIHTTTEDVQSLFNNITLFGYKFRVDKVDPASNGKQVIFTTIYRDPASPVDDDAVAWGLEGRKITYVSSPEATPLIDRLMDAVIEEQKADVKWYLQMDGFARFSAKIPLSHRIEYAAMRKDAAAKRQAAKAAQTP